MTRQEKAIQKWIAARFFHFEPDEDTLAQIQPPFKFTEDGGYDYSEYTNAPDTAHLSFRWADKYRKGTTLSSLEISGEDVTTFIDEVSKLMEGEVDD